MPKTDTRPWAFDDCPQWKAFKQKAEEAGLRFKIMDEWTSYDSRFRGSDVRRYAIYYGSPSAERRAFVTSIIVEGLGPDGFALYYESLHRLKRYQGLAHWQTPSVAAAPSAPAPAPGSHRAWTTVREMSEQADLRDLTAAMAVYLDRIWEELS